MKTIKIVLMIAIFLTVASAQSDSLKQQVKVATVLTVATITTGVITVVEAGKTGYIATKEAYNSELVQNGIDSGKKGTKKAYHMLISYIDSVKK